MNEVLIVNLKLWGIITGSLELEFYIQYLIMLKIALCQSLGYNNR